MSNVQPPPKRRSNKMSEISNRVMLQERFDDGSSWYCASCACGHQDCNLTLWFEHSEITPNMIDLIMYEKLKYSSYWAIPDTWWNRLKARMSGVLRILFTGYVEVEEGFVFHGEEQISTFIQALEEGKRRLKIKKSVI